MQMSARIWKLLHEKLRFLLLYKYIKGNKKRNKLFEHLYSWKSPKFEFQFYYIRDIHHLTSLSQNFIGDKLRMCSLAGCKRVRLHIFVSNTQLENITVSTSCDHLSLR